MSGANDISDYYEQHAKLVQRYLYRLCGDADIAEELCQETFFQAVRTVDRYRGECKPSVWLCSIARNCWYKYLEKNKHSRPADDEIISAAVDSGAAGIAAADTAAASDNVLESLADREDMMAIYTRMQKLRGEVREVMYLRILGELSFAEIGSIMGKTENWARVTFFRGKREIQEDMI